MEHPHWDLASIVTDNPYALLDSYFRRTVEDRPHRIGWCLPPDAQERLGTLNCVAELSVVTDRESASNAASGLWHQLREGEGPRDLGPRVARFSATWEASPRACGARPCRAPSSTSRSTRSG